jgi:hypothetical protein
MAQTELCLQALCKFPQKLRSTCYTVEDFFYLNRRTTIYGDLNYSPNVELINEIIYLHTCNMMAQILIEPRLFRLTTKHRLGYFCCLF